MAPDRNDIVLVSDALRELRNDQHNAAYPVMQDFMSLDNDELDLDSAYFDEEDVLRVVGYMVDRIQEVFRGNVWMPGSVRTLRRAFAEAKELGDEYLCYALQMQKERVDAAIRGLSGADESQYRAIVRGIDRRYAAIDTELSRSLSERVDARMIPLVRRHAKKIHRMSFVEVVAMTDELHIKADVIRHEIRMSVLSKVRLWSEQIDEMIAQAEELSCQLYMREAYERLLSSTVNRISSLVAKGVACTLDEGDDDEESANLLAKPVSKLRSKAAPKSARKKKRQKDGRKGRKKRDGAKPEDEVVGSADIAETERLFNLSLAQLKVLLNVACSYDKIRILSSPEASIAQRFLEGWQSLLGRLGYSGRLEIVSYENLSNTSDLCSPLLVPSKMNVHHNLWKRDRFENAFVIAEGNPTLISRYLDYQQFD